MRAPKGTTLYHTTAKTNRGAIRRHGLKARHPQNHPRANYRNDRIDLASQPVGVYGEPSIVNARWWHRIRFAETGRDIWKIDAAGLPMALDEQNLFNNGKVILCDVPPERLTLVETFKPTPKGLAMYRESHMQGEKVAA